MPRVQKHCVMCGATKAPGLFARRKTCESCYQRNNDEARRAIAKVTTQIVRGLMDKASTKGCADCDRTASVYDHRDYTKPLEVTPVCRGCNVRRGSAFNSFYRPDSSTRRTEGPQPQAAIARPALALRTPIPSAPP